MLTLRRFLSPSNRKHRVYTCTLNKYLLYFKFSKKIIELNLTSKPSQPQVGTLKPDLAESINFDMLITKIISIFPGDWRVRILENVGFKLLLY